jgi:hypothetical protein
MKVLRDLSPDQKARVQSFLDEINAVQRKHRMSIGSSEYLIASLPDDEGGLEIELDNLGEPSHTIEIAL